MKNHITVKYAGLSQPPTQATEGSAGFDLIAVGSHREVFEASTMNTYYEYDTHLKLEPRLDLLHGWSAMKDLFKLHFLVMPRSSISKYSLMLTNSVGLIDSDYRGTIKLRFKKIKEDNFQKLELYQQGDAIAQLVPILVPNIKFVNEEELTQTARAEGGFGSTGN